MKNLVSKIISLSTKGFIVLAVLSTIVILVNSALDIYNTFAYDRAILKDSPYGYTPLLEDPANFSSSEGRILSGEFVYVKDWLSAYHNNIAFAKVRSKLKEGYINKELLVETNINIKPIVSAIILLGMLIYTIRKIYGTIKLKFN